MPHTTPRTLTVAVDIDGVLYECVEMLRWMFHLTTGRPLASMPDPGIYDIEKAWDLPRGTLMPAMIDSVRAGFLFHQGPAHLPGLAGLRALKDAGHRILLVSARDFPGIEDLCYEATHSWLTSPEVDATFDELVLATDKETVHYDVLIDDYEKNVLAARAAGRHSILLNRHWNIDVQLDQHSWPQAVEAVAAFAQGAEAA